MAYQSKYTGLQIDDILDSVEWKQSKIEDLASIRAGAQKGATALQSYTEKYTGTVTGIKINGVIKSGSGIIDLGTISTTETDPIFSASPASSITTEKIAEWDNKVDKVSGKQLSTEDFTTALKNKLEGLSNYDDTELSDAVETLRGDFDEIVSGDTTTAIKTFNEVIAFLDGLTDTQDLESIIANIEQQIAGKMDTLISGTNIKTINGESILGEGDLTIESGAKVYELDLTGRGESGSITEEEWNILKDVDTLKIKSDIGSFLVHKTFPSIFLMLGEDVRLFSSLEITRFVDEENRPTFSAQTFVFMGPTQDPPLTYGMLATVTPTKTSELENDSDFITSEDLAGVALSGSYNDLQDTPTIPSAVTESTVSGWGFTKNAGTITGVKVNGITKSPTSGVVDLGTVITDVSNLATKDEAIVKDLTGELITAQTQALYGGGSVYALPDQANGDEDDVLVSKNSVKTINGESIFGSGDIEISGGSGGGEDIRYFTEFTVEDFIEACETNNVITYDTTELFNAMKNNKVICVPYRGYDKGFIVASYRSGENVEYPHMYLQKGDVEYYAGTGDSYELSGELPIYNNVQIVEIEGGEGFPGYLEVFDNFIYKITDTVDYLVPIPDYIQKGATICFMSGESGTTIEMYNAFWANGEIPQIEPNTHYELSLMLNSDYEYNVVLTKFKLVE